MSDTVTMTRDQWDRILMACASMSHPLSDLDSLAAATAAAGLEAQSRHLRRLYERIGAEQVRIENVLRETVGNCQDSDPHPNSKEA